MDTVLAFYAATWGIAMAVSPVLQIRKIVHHRSSHGVSVGYMTVLFIGFLIIKRETKREPTNPTTDINADPSADTRRAAPAPSFDAGIVRIQAAPPPSETTAPLESAPRVPPGVVTVVPPKSSGKPPKDGPKKEKNCDPPYTVDEHGFRHYTRGCN